MTMQTDTYIFGAKALVLEYSVPATGECMIYDVIIC